jgi:hypothetical protein
VAVMKPIQLFSDWRLRVSCAQLASEPAFQRGIQGQYGVSLFQRPFAEKEMIIEDGALGLFRHQCAG